MRCLKCQKQTTGCCDNGCSTLLCIYCEIEYFKTIIDGKQFFVIGHDPHCKYTPGAEYYTTTITGEFSSDFKITK